MSTGMQHHTVTRTGYSLCVKAFIKRDVVYRLLLRKHVYNAKMQDIVATASAGNEVLR